MLLDARAKLARAQHDSQEAFQTYTASIEAERQARHEVHVAEQRRDDLSESSNSLSGTHIVLNTVSVFTLLSRTQSTQGKILADCQLD